MKYQIPNNKEQTIPKFQFLNLKIIVLVLFVIWDLLSGTCTQAIAAPTPTWATYGLQINDTYGNTAQQNPRIVNLENGNFTLVWEDSRSGFYDIYAQRIDENGNLLWNNEGVIVCNFLGNQNFPQAISDGSGGTIVVWQDYRSGNSDIYAQKINQSGQMVWPPEGIPICVAAAGQFSPQLVSDGAGGAIIVWHDYRRGGGEDIFSQRVNAQGKVIWKEDGIPVSIAQGTQWYPQIASDGAGGAIVVWTDGRKSAGDNDIYGQRISPGGNLLWDNNGVEVCSAKLNQEKPVIIPINKGAIIAWNDFRLNNSDVFAQKIDLDGKLLWKKEGVPVCNAAYNQQNPTLAEDGAGGAIVAWEDERGESSDIFAQKIYSDGRPAWQENGRPICKADGKQKNVSIIKLAQEGWVMIWEDARFGTTDLFSQKINNAGTPLWQLNGVVIASSPLSQEAPAAAITRSDDLVVCWQDSRFGANDIYAQKVSTNGALQWTSSGKIINNSLGSVVQQNIKAVETTKKEIILCFEDARSGFFNIYSQKVNQAGNLAWGAHGLGVAKVAANQINPQMVPDNSGGAIIAWEDYRNEALPSIRAQRLSSAGEKIWGESLALAAVKSRQIKPVMITDNAGGAIVAWQDNRNVLSLQDIYIQRVSASGSLLWGSKGKVAISANGDQADLDMVSDGTGGAYLTWTDYRAGDRNPDIYAQHIDGNSNNLWNDEGVLICGAPDVQRSPKVIADEDGGIMVAWTDKGGGSYDIYAQRVDKQGRPIWMTDGIPINQLSRTQQTPLLANQGTVVWEDYRFGNWDIFAGKVNTNGQLAWGEEGVPVATFSHTQYAPIIAQGKNNSVIIAWEDYRSGKQYEIYVQKLNQEGKLDWPVNGIKVESKEGARAPQIINSTDSFYIFWEDYRDGGKAIYGQRFLTN